MYNDWFTIGPLTIHGYGVMIAVGILMAFFVGERMAKKTGMDPNHVDTLIIVCLLTGYLGSKITYVFTVWDQFLANPKAVLGADGWVVYGGILGGILGAWTYCRIKKISFFHYANLLFPSVALAQGFGRIGCFFAGCCYGKETHGALGITFTHSDYAPNNVKLIPTQLISSAGDFILFYILYKIYMDESTRDETMGWYLLLYSAGRFVIEFLRGDSARGFIGALSTSQFIGLFLIAAGIIVLIQVKKNGKAKKEAVL